MATGLGAAVGALRQFVEGFAAVIQKAVGPELLRNLEAAHWLGQVADCLERAAGGPAEASLPGELSFHLERLGPELRGSKLEGQEGALRQRLEAAVAALSIDPAVVAQTAGYFRAASRSLLPAAPTAEAPPATHP